MIQRVPITPEYIRSLVDQAHAIQRDEQLFAWEDAYELMVKIGQLIVPGFKIDSNNSFAYENIAKWVVGDPSMKCSGYDGNGERPGDLCKGLYIQGPTGTGKSIAINLCRKACSAFKIIVNASNPYQPLTWSSYNTDNICSAYENSGDISEFKKSPVICIQDLGTEPSEVIYMGNRRNCLRSILEYRGDCYDKITHITSNIPIFKTGEYYGERVQSRLYQMCNPITMLGTDRRIK